MSQTLGLEKLLSFTPSKFPTATLSITTGQFYPSYGHQRYTNWFQYICPVEGSIVNRALSDRPKLRSNLPQPPFRPIHPLFPRPQLLRLGIPRLLLV